MEQLVPNHGNYKKLISYQKTNVIFCLTYYFVEHYLQKGDRTYDQMLQAARSGKQNIIEGSAASSTSAKTEIKLVNVAKASLQELIEDYDTLTEDQKRLSIRREMIEYNKSLFHFYLQICNHRNHIWKEKTRINTDFQPKSSIYAGIKKWRRRESNPRPQRCERCALPTELRPHRCVRATMQPGHFFCLT